jgi:hypothetical protein
MNRNVLQAADLKANQREPQPAHGRLDHAAWTTTGQHPPQTRGGRGMAKLAINGPI